MNGGQLRGLRELQHMYKTIDSIRTQGVVGTLEFWLCWRSKWIVEVRRSGGVRKL